MAKRLANQKTKSQSGFEYVLNLLELNTPFGEKVKKEVKPFFPGQEKELGQELERVDIFKKAIEKDPAYFDKVEEAFMEMKDVTFSVRRASKNSLSVVELFELKVFLLAQKMLYTHLLSFKEKFGADLPETFKLNPVASLLDILDPRKEGLPTFYIYDEFSEKLRELRDEKREREKLIRSRRKDLCRILKEDEDLEMTPKFEHTVSKQDTDQIKRLDEISLLCRWEEDYTSVTYTLKDDEEVGQAILETERLQLEIEEEELKVRKYLSLEIAKYEDVLLENMSRTGLMDFCYAKALLSVKYKMVKAEIVEEHFVSIQGARHLEVEAFLVGKGKSYCPTDLAIKEGVSIISGANMGGKTVSLRLMALVALLCQYGFFIPAEKAVIGLSSFVQMLMGDTQSLQRGLSSFGGEMEELREALDHAEKRAFLLVDEIASGTNPGEGAALSRALASFLMEKEVITLMTTHFDKVTEVEGVVAFQVVGLANADFDKLKRELRYANRKERIELVARHMDYRLIKIEEKRDVPKEALKIAEMLGVYSDIIDRAKNYLEDN